MKSLQHYAIRVWHTILGLWLCYQLILHKAAQRRLGFGFSPSVISGYFALVPEQLIRVARFEVRHNDPFVTQWHNADHMLRWLDDVNFRIKTGKYLDYAVMDKVHEKVERTLIDMLTDSEGCPIQPLDVRNQLIVLLRSIEDGIDRAPSELRTYYTNRFDHVTTSLVNLIDAYYKAAL